MAAIVHHLIKFFPPPETRQEEPRGFGLALPVTCILSLLLPPSVRVPVSLVAVALIIAQIPRYHGENSIMTYMTANAAAGSFFKWLDIFVGGPAEERFWRVSEGEAQTRRQKAEGAEAVAVNGRTGGGGGGGDKAADEVEDELDREERNAVYKLGLFGKLCWATALWTSTRGPGWNWKVKNVPDGPPVGYSRVKFVAQNIFKSVYCYAIVDILSIYMRSSALRQRDFFALPLHMQVVGVWCEGVRTVYSLKLTYNVATAALVAARVSRPEHNPALMGSFSREAYSVRRMWGGPYHQMLRRNTSAPGIALARLLRLRRGGLASRYLQLYTAFAISAAIHVAGALNTSSAFMARNQLYFYTMQPVAITAEDLVCDAARAMGVRESRATRWLGVLGMLAWFSWSCRFVVASNASVGFYEIKFFPSVIEEVGKQYGYFKGL